jgi:stage VI sporulation protein D
MSSQHQQGLRFDIYERVHLSEGISGIKELDEVELVPHIQVLSQGEQAVLKGNLLLTGVYVDQEDGAGRTLEHLIPVEITLPMNRVQRVEDISVDIENFDVDLLSMRSLNVTGVLSLNGIELDAAAEPEEWRQPEAADMVFTHQLQQPYYGVQGEQEAPEREPFAEAARNEPVAAVEPVQTPNPNPVPNPIPNPIPNPPVYVEEQAPVAVAPDQIANIEPETIQEPASKEAPPAETESASDKKGMKVALGSKGPEQAESLPFGLKSLLHKAVKSGDSQTRQAEAVEAGYTPSPQDALEWKKLLLSTESEQQQFRKLRLAIVQKEETLEKLAQRYDINPREIILYNRLSDQEIRAGQVVYIPK